MSAPLDGRYSRISDAQIKWSEEHNELFNKDTLEKSYGFLWNGKYFIARYTTGTETKYEIKYLNWAQRFAHWAFGAYKEIIDPSRDDLLRTINNTYRKMKAKLDELIAEPSPLRVTGYGGVTPRVTAGSSTPKAAAAAVAAEDVEAAADEAEVETVTPAGRGRGGEVKLGADKLTALEKQLADANTARQAAENALKQERDRASQAAEQAKKDADAALAAVQTDRDTAQAALKQAQGDRDAAQAVVKQAQGDRDAAQKSFDARFSRQQVDFDAQNRSLVDQLQVLGAQAANIKGDEASRQRLEAELKHARTLVTQHSITITDLQEELRAATERPLPQTADVGTQVSFEDAQVPNLQRDLSDAQAAITARQNDVDRSAKRVLDLQSQLSKLQTELASARDAENLAKQQAATNFSRAATSDNEKLQFEMQVQAATAQIAQLENRLQEAQAEFTSKATAAAADAQTRINDLERRVQDRDLHIDSMRKSTSDLETDLETTSRGRQAAVELASSNQYTRVRELERSLADVGAAKSALEQQVNDKDAAFRQQAAESKKRAAQYDHLVSQLETRAQSAEASLARLQHELQGATETYSGNTLALSKRIQELRDQTATQARQLQEKEGAFKQQEQQLQAQLSTVGRKLFDLRSSNQQVSTRADELAAEKARLSGELASVRAQFGKDKAALEGRVVDRDSLQAELARRTQALADAQAAKSAAETELASVRAQLAKVQTELTTASTERERALQESSAQLERTNAEYATGRRVLQGELARLHKQLDDRTAYLGGVANAYDTTKRALEEAERRIASLQQALERPAVAAPSEEVAKAARPAAGAAAVPASPAVAPRPVAPRVVPTPSPAAARKEKAAVRADAKALDERFNRQKQIAESFPSTSLTVRFGSAEDVAEQLKEIHARNAKIVQLGKDLIKLFREQDRFNREKDRILADAVAKEAKLIKESENILRESGSYAAAAQGAAKERPASERKAAAEKAARDERTAVENKVDDEEQTRKQAIEKTLAEISTLIREEYRSDEPMPGMPTTLGYAQGFVEDAEARAQKADAELLVANAGMALRSIARYTAAVQAAQKDLDGARDQLATADRNRVSDYTIVQIRKRVTEAEARLSAAQDALRTARRNADEAIRRVPLE